MVGRGAFMLVGALSVSCYINALSHTHLATARRAHAGSRVRSARLPSRAAPTMARDDEEEEADGDEGDDLQIMIWISDPKTETPIRCYMESSTEVDGSLYALAHPVDIPVIIATCEDEEKGLNGIEDDAAIDAVFDIAKEVLREEGFALKRTPFMLTVEEDEEAFDLDDISGEGEGEMGAYAEDEEDEDEMDVDDLEEGAEVLAKFFHAGQQYYVAEPLEPTFIVARQLSGTRFTLLDESELERVKPMLERSFIELNEAFAGVEDSDE